MFFLDEDAKEVLTVPMKEKVGDKMLEEIITYPDYEKAKAMASTFSVILGVVGTSFQLTFILLNRCKQLS